jgi:hypothetical protein
LARHGFSPETVALFRILPSELHGIAIAKGSEKLALIGGRAVPLEYYPSGFAVPLPGSPCAFMSYSSGPNVRARAIASLRHPNIIFIPSSAHILALLCGEYLMGSRRSTVITKSQQLVHFFNSSSSLWLPLLRAEVSRPLGTSLSLVSAVETRWMSTWLSAVSVLQIRDPLLSVFTSSAGKERVQEAMASHSAKYKSLKNVVAIVRDMPFFDEIGAHLDALLPTIESSLVMQGGSVTLADDRNCLARQHQALVAAIEDAVIVQLEKRYYSLEKPLLILALWLPPTFAEVARRVWRAVGVQGRNGSDGASSTELACVVQSVVQALPVVWC